MKVMVIVKATASSEAGTLPSAAGMAAMGEFNRALASAGIIESGDGLKPSSGGLRVRFDGTKREVTSGPFAATNELIAGYWIWNVASMDEALAWVKKCPNPMPEESEIEIRPFYSAEDFTAVEGSEAILAQEEALRQKVAMQKTEVKNYLFFHGRCEEALNYYRQHLNADIKMLLRFNQSPDPMPEGMLQAGFEEKIMHAEFSLGNTYVLASDGCNDSGHFSGFRIALIINDAPDAQRVFAALADGGTIDMPLAQTFWSPLYGMVTDQFGVGWMVMLPGENQP